MLKIIIITFKSHADACVAFSQTMGITQDLENPFKQGNLDHLNQTRM